MTGGWPRSIDRAFILIVRVWFRCGSGRVGGGLRAACLHSGQAYHCGFYSVDADFHHDFAGLAFTVSPDGVVSSGGGGDDCQRQAVEGADGISLKTLVAHWVAVSNPNDAAGALDVDGYALTDPMEYFAEATEAFFSRNDFFPFTNEEFGKHDPGMFELLGKLWGATPKP